jgi:hypothetical protein
MLTHLHTGSPAGQEVRINVIQIYYIKNNLNLFRVSKEVDLEKHN